MFTENIGAISAFHIGLCLGAYNPRRNDFRNNSCRSIRTARHPQGTQVSDLPSPKVRVVREVGTVNSALTGAATMIRRRRRIGMEPGDIHVVGQRLGKYPLLYGQGLGFDINQSHLVRAAAQDLKRQLLAKGSPEHMTRLMPTLSPIGSLFLPLPSHN